MAASTDKKSEIDTPPLSDREREILRLVVQSFIATAGPVGSRYLAKTTDLGLSAASIRNTMSDLEDLGLLDHPYTSAGRIPTELGYRTFVMELMESPGLSAAEKNALRRELDLLTGDTRRFLRESSKLLGRLTNLLGLVLSPRISTGVMERLEVVPLSSSRIMFVISVGGGLIKTIILKFDSDLTRHDLDVIVAMLNERLAGLTLEEIRKTCSDRVKDIDEVTGVVQLIMDEGAALFSDEADGSRLQYGDTRSVIAQPEFAEPDELRTFMELIEDRDSVIDILERASSSVDEPGHAEIRIGSAVGDRHDVSDYSLVTARYMLGRTAGTVGVLGPKRMDYARVVSLVEGMAALMSNISMDVRH
jgi:heat-inducible transcriptional repressor